MKIVYARLLTGFFVLAFNFIFISSSHSKTNEATENQDEFTETDTNKIVANKDYQSLFYLDFAFVSDDIFPSWTSSKQSMTFDEYVSLVKNWIIANPSQYSQLVANRVNFTRITSDNLVNYSPERAQVVKNNINEFGTLMIMQKKINENFPSVSEVQNQLGGIAYFTGLIHVDDITLFQEN